jgi:hypothetical protein
VFSGVLCDRIGKRKLLVGFGYGLGAITKPAFPLASSAAEVLAARFFDRIGKGIRGAPRDALVADITPPEIRGAAYGIRQALDTVGAFAGPLLAIALMAIYANDFRAVFWWAVVPAAAAVALVIFGVQEPDGTKPSCQRGWPIRREALARMTSAYWWVVAVGIIFTMARFSEAFLVLKGQAAGLPIALVPLVMVWMNISPGRPCAQPPEESNSGGRSRLARPSRTVASTGPCSTPGGMTAPRGSSAACGAVYGSVRRVCRL